MHLIRDVYLDIALACVGIAYALHEWRGVPLQTLGLLLACISLALWIKAGHDLGDAFAVLPRASKLVEVGLYRRLRHPIYLFSTLTLIGIAVALQVPVLYYFILLVVLAQIIRARTEEKVLGKRFGSAYAEYKSRTWF